MSQARIIWLRRDLRLADNPALYHAARAGPLVAVYVLDDEAAGAHRYGGASRWWLHHSLESLSRSLEQRGSKLILRRGQSVRQLCALAEELGARTIHANRHYEPWWRKVQAELKSRLDLRLHDANYLLEPGMVRSGSGEPYKIYTPFSKRTRELLPPRDPLPAPEVMAPLQGWPEGDALADWGLLPAGPDWAGGLRGCWQVGEAAAQARLARWADLVDRYAETRNLPSIEGTSRLSPHLHFGEISPAQLWHALCARCSSGWRSFEKELIWRDYAQNVICQFPAYGVDNHRKPFDGLAWRDPERDKSAAADLAAWQKGRTGYPIVDAGMRQLWQTGWMHNRVRMIVASFLVKHLLIDWRHGERWFWDCLVDADYASNAVNWQWSAGTGVDSNMFARIMAPLSQSEKFCAGDYIRRYVPELAQIDDSAIHDPEAHGCRPADYPPKIIGHREARERALAAYRAMKESEA